MSNVNTEQVIAREEYCLNLAYDACQMHDLFPPDVEESDIQRIFQVGFKMGFRHPNGDRDED